jgi:hypothetical protein
MKKTSEDMFVLTEWMHLPNFNREVTVPRGPVRQPAADVTWDREKIARFRKRKGWQSLQEKCNKKQAPHR